MTYEEAHTEARSIAFITASRKMPPWFADRAIGHFANDPSLTTQEIAILDAWSKAKAPAGDPHDAPPPREWTNGWNIPQPDAIVKMPKPVALPPKGNIDYTYEIVRTNFTEAKWIQLSEIRPLSRESVHHAVVYVRPPGSKWLEHAPVGVPFTAADMTDTKSKRDALWTDADILLVYAPGSSPDRWPDGMAKLVPAGSDLVFQMHYMARGHAATDQTEIGLIFAKQPPQQRVLTLQLTNDHFVIPPGADNFRVEARRYAAERRDSAQLSSAHAPARKAIRVQHRAQGRNHRAIAPRQLGFLLAIELSTRSAAAARGRNRVASCRVVRQLESQYAQS